jgi:hypothetical protein
MRQRSANACAPLTRNDQRTNVARSSGVIPLLVVTHDGHVVHPHMRAALDKEIHS